jgi:hypothetical protein
MSDDCDCDHDCDVTVESGNSTSGNRSGGCFIATAAYGSYAEPNVMILREFRDNVLHKTVLGRVFIRCYYKTSPPVAQIIESREYAKKMVRSLLKPIVYFVSLCNDSSGHSKSEMSP